MAATGTVRTGPTTPSPQHTINQSAQESNMDTGEPRILWDDATISKLRHMWEEGNTTAVIGRELNITKNAVIGKAHRLGLHRRVSPIGSQEPKATRFVSRPRSARSTKVEAQKPNRVLPVQPAPSPKATFVEQPTLPPLGKRPCCWPIGDPGSPVFRFCDAPSEAGKPYCPAHCDDAYQRRKASGQAA